MPTTTEKGYVIGVKISGGTAGQVTIHFTNARTGERVHKLTVSNGVTTNLNDEKEWKLGYNDGDIIDITGSGLKTGNTTHTVDRTKGGKTITISMTDVSTANAPAVSI